MSEALDVERGRRRAAGQHGAACPPAAADQGRRRADAAGEFRAGEAGSRRPDDVGRAGAAGADQPPVDGSDAAGAGSARSRRAGSPIPRDGRRAVISVTDEGRQILRDRRNESTEQLARALSAGFTAAELAPAHGGRAADRATGADGLMPAAGTDDSRGRSQRPVPVGRAVEYDRCRVHVRARRVDRDHRPARDLPRHPPGSAGDLATSVYLLWMIMGYRLVQAVLVVTARPPRRHVRPGPDLQRRFRRVHRCLDPAVVRPVRGRSRRALADRLAGAAGHRRLHAHRQLGRDPHRRFPGRSGAASRSASTRSRPSPASSSAWSPAACWRHSTGARCSGSTCPSASSARSGLTASSATTASGTAAGSTGGATSPSPLGLGAILIAITNGIQPYGHDTMGWTNPAVLGLLAGGVLLLVAFGLIESAGRRADVPAQPVPHPGLHGRERRRSRRCHRQRRAAVHADHLAAGDLAAAAWL